MKNLMKYSLIGMIAVLSSCSGMTDTIDEYFELGEIVYIAKADSVNTYAGDERFLLEFWISDPRASEMYVSWNMKQDSVLVPIPEGYDATQPFRIYVGRNEKTLEDGSYVLNLVTRDKHGNYSVTDEYLVNVYGDTYVNSLLNKFIQSATYNSSTSEVTLLWGGALNAQEYGVTLSYTTLDGSIVSGVYTTGELVSDMVLENVDIRKPVNYTTMYIPEPTAIDTFYTALAKIEISEKVNVALNKETKTSDILSPYEGSRAVDGNTNTTTSRWVTDDTNNEHWLEIDLGGAYPISAMETWNDNPTTKTFRLQIEQNGEWVTIYSQDNNTLNNFYGEFPEVTVSKVRYYIPAYQTNRVRLFDIAIYAVTKY